MVALWLLWMIGCVAWLVGSLVCRPGRERTTFLAVGVVLLAVAAWAIVALP